MLRSAFGGGFGYALPDGTISVPAKTPAAAAATATAAAEEDTAAEEGPEHLEAKLVNPTAHFLDELSPTSEADERGSFWSDAEAVAGVAVGAAGAAAGAAMGAAGVAAGVAADVASAATQSTLKVASSLGQGWDGEDRRPVPGSWKKQRYRDEEGLVEGKGKVKLRPRRVDAQKVRDMSLNLSWTNEQKVGTSCVHVCVFCLCFVFLFFAGRRGWGDGGGGGICLSLFLALYHVLSVGKG